MTWVPGESERVCPVCGTWHKWTDQAPRCWCGHQVKNITMRPQQVTRAKLAECRANKPPIPRTDPLVWRCECHRWHTFIWRDAKSITCVCGRPLPREGLTPEQVTALKAEEAEIATWMAQNNDMEGCCWLSSGPYD